MILLIDNYDSFVYNLGRYFERLGHETRVVRNDAITPAAIEELRPQAIVLSPGPRTPAEAGCTVEVVRQLAGKFPMLGICLGHQAIGAALGGRVVAAQPMHGRASEAVHDGTGIFSGLPSPLAVGRYHSLILDEATLPAQLNVTARTREGTIMAVAHREWPVIGVQFHPESILTDCGYELLANFSRIAGLDVPASLPTIASERPAVPQHAPLPSRPVTF